ncbi:MAG: nucleotidyltransferase domain-containing protein [Ginsengibacter sp.]
MNKQLILQQLKKVKPVLTEKYGLIVLALFDSYSRSEETDLSDIDIMVDYESPMGLKSFGMVYELKNVFKEKNVQVVSRAGIKLKYSDRIKQDLIYA